MKKSSIKCPVRNIAYDSGFGYLHGSSINPYRGFGDGCGFSYGDGSSFLVFGLDKNYQFVNIDFVIQYWQ